jgi:hypothetical protein
LDFETIKKFFNENGATTRRSTTATTRRETDRTAGRSAGLRLISETSASESEGEGEGEGEGDACRRERRAGTPTASFVHRR